jgi:pimeloyl-ACP methyl ester carboxylesterase
MQLAHEVHGPDGAPVLVLVHGITESRHSWRPLIAPLSASWRVVAVDLRGHGESPAGDAYDPISYATDVVETLGTLNISDPLAVGHSLGGVVVSALAALGGASRVINVDQPLRLAGFKDALAPLEPMLRGDDAAFAAAMDALWQAMDGPLPPTERARIAAHGRPDRAVVLGTWASVFESSVEELDAVVDSLAAGITVPYLSLHGIDPGPEYGAWLAARVPTATVEVWPDHGHYPHLVDPDRFVARLAAFAG